MKRKQHTRVAITLEDIQRAMRMSNLHKARHMLCIKMGWTREFQRFVNHMDVDANGTPEKAEFWRKMSRLLAFNYDVHRCPDVCGFPRLFPQEKPGSLPVRFPPEWRQN